ncbi:hypothetical protein H0H93_004078 [Arthromyces matolae]|nr:hypothetical protein H0H93_004078 [Arthromyces matolae]
MPGTYAEIQQCLPFDCLAFPSITSAPLYYDGIQAVSARRSADYEVLTAGHRLKDIIIAQNGYIPEIEGGPTITNIIALAAFSSNSVNNVCISGNMDWHVIDILATQRSLRYLDLNFITSYPSWRRLSLRGIVQFRSLVTLRIVLPKGVSFEASQGGQITSLTKLAIEAQSITCFQSLCSIAPNVTDLELIQSSGSEEAVEEWREFFHTLSMMVPSLTSFLISNKPRIREHALRVYLYIEPLLSLPLERLFLRNPAGHFLLLTDQEIEKISSRLSRLETVEIFSGAHYLDPRPTHIGFFALIRNCPSLENVALSADGREVIFWG